MVTLDDLVAFADGFLDVESISDYCPKGLQVEGRREINRIVTGVSACMELFVEADARGADAILVHHGMFWDSDQKVVRGSLKGRLKFLLDKDISLIAYHLPLDRHPEVGNNIEIIKRLGLVDEKPFGGYRGKTISYMASVPVVTPVGDFIKSVRDLINPDLRHYPFGPDKIQTVAVCSGGAPELAREAIARNVDLFLTGEDSEWVYHLSKEEGLHYVAAGHHATERFGPIALGETIEREFDVEVVFVDIPNPI